jgi:hypothetical protein
MLQVARSFANLIVASLGSSAAEHVHATVQDINLLDLGLLLLLLLLLGRGTTSCRRTKPRVSQCCEYEVSV